jgi:hypothetical protein
MYAKDNAYGNGYGNRLNHDKTDYYRLRQRGMAADKAGDYYKQRYRFD